MRPALSSATRRPAVSACTASATSACSDSFGTGEWEANANAWSRASSAETPCVGGEAACRCEESRDTSMCPARAPHSRRPRMRLQRINWPSPLSRRMCVSSLLESAIEEAGP
eukprot:scaffold23779_cov112-Isochrysis_galbana.AAC.2